MKPPMNMHFYLMAEYGTAEIPLTDVAKKYWGHDKPEVDRWARQGRYPFPVKKIGTQKSGWFVNIDHLAAYLNQCNKQAENLHVG